MPVRESEVGRTNLGNTETRISRMGFGTYRLGKKQEIQGAIRLMGYAYDSGVNFFDTSDNYGPAEEWIGQALQSSVLPREGIVIATKTGLPRSYEEVQEFAKRGKKQDTSPKRIRQQVESSLRLMGIEAIDLYQVHVHDPEVKPLDIAVVMNDLTVEGKIRHWGISNYNEPGLVKEISAVSNEAGLLGPVSLQDHYSLIDHRYEGAIRSAQNLGMSVLAWSPLKNGLITERLFAGDSALTQNISPAVIEKLGALQTFAADHGANVQQLAIAWLMNQEGVIPLLGAYNQEYFDDLIKAAGWKLNEEELNFIDGVLLAAQSAG